MRDVTTPFPAFFAAWAFDHPIGAHAGKKMFAAWLNAGLIAEAEEGYTPTTKGRATAHKIAKQAQKAIRDKVAAEPKRRTKQAERS